MKAPPALINVLISEKRVDPYISYMLDNGIKHSNPNGNSAQGFFSN